MKIKVTEANRPKIEAAIEDAEGRATARCATYRDVVRAVSLAEARLAPLPKRLWVGTVVTYDDSRVPASYGYHAESTVITVERFASGWFFTGATRQRAKMGKVSDKTHPAHIAIPSHDDLLGSFLSDAGLHLR